MSSYGPGNVEMRVAGLQVGRPKLDATENNHQDQECHL